MTRTRLLGVLAALAPYVPDPDDARDLLRRELARAEYRPGLLQRARDAIAELVDDLFSGTDLPSVPGWWGPLVLLLLVAGLAWLVVALVRGRSGRRGRDHDAAEVFGGERRPAAEHRARARRAREAGRFDEAVLEAMRALAAGLIERGLVPDTLGLTVHELVTTAQGRFPAYADRLDAGGRDFDEVRYGRGEADAARADALLALESAIVETRPDQASDGPVRAVPR